MANAIVTLALHQSTFLAGIARAQSSVSALGASVRTIGTKGFLVAGTAAAAFGAATAIGIKKAFDLGGTLADMSAISGRSAKEILLLRRALEDAGVSMEKIDRFILTGQDRGQVIARALANLTAGDWRDAAQSIGKQADILDKNAQTFDRISDLLGRSGQKLQGFFVGAAGKIANSLLPLLEKFDKMDFASQGERFGAALLKGAQALAGFFKNPELLFAGVQDAFTAIALGMGNVLVAVFKQATSVFAAGLQAALEQITKPNKSVFNLQIAMKKGVQTALGTNMSGDLNSYGRALQGDIDKLTEQAAKTQGPGFLDRMDELLKGSKIDIKDIFGAGDALANARGGSGRAAELGRNALPIEAAGASRRDLGKSQQAAAAAIGRITFAGAGGGIDESAFGKTKMASEDEFATRWGLPKPSEQGGASKSDEHLAKIAEDTARQREITERAWGGE